MLAVLRAEEFLLKEKTDLTDWLKVYFLYPVEFEFDPAKSSANKMKHGLDFEAARALWDDPDSVAFPARSDDEDRFALLSMLKGKLWVAFYTPRGDRIRIISVRRARTNETELYES